MATQNSAQDVSDNWAFDLIGDIALGIKVGAPLTDLVRAVKSAVSARELQQAQSDALLEDTLEWIHNSPDLTKEKFNAYCTTPQSSAPVVGDGLEHKYNVLRNLLQRSWREVHIGTKKYQLTLTVTPEYLEQIESALTGRGGNG